jgi:ABC-type transport system involved in multi-copper enzyme maturation permease subunit
MWRKLWLESRWRFLVALAVVAGVSGIDVAQADLVMPRLGLSHEQFNQFVWKMYFSRISLAWTISMLLLAAGGLLREQSQGTGIFSLSLPISRSKWLMTRGAAALGEAFVLALVPAVVIPAVAITVGYGYSPWEAAKLSLLMFLTGLSAFGVGVLGSSLIQVEYAPILLGVAYVFVTGMAANLILPQGHYSEYITGRYHMDAQWHLTRGWPWWAVLGNIAVGALFVAIAARRLERRDF